MLNKENVLVVTKKSLTDAADSIRERTGDTDLIRVSDLDEAIDEIPSGGSDPAEISGNQWVMALLNNPSPATRYALFTIPEDVTVLGDYDSSYGKGSALAEIPAIKFYGKYVTDIKKSMWVESKYVEELDFPACTRIRENIAEKCANLRIINFPLLRNLDNGFAFSDCPQLIVVNLPELLSAGRGILRNNSGMTQALLPKLTEIVGGNAGLNNDAALTKLLVPALTRINNQAMESLPSLVNLSLPACIKIESEMKNNTLLEGLFLPGDTLCSLTKSTFLTGSKIAAGTGTIWVNDSLVNDYKSASNWIQYASVIRSINDYTGDFNYNEGVTS